MLVNLIYFIDIFIDIFVLHIKIYASININTTTHREFFFTNTLQAN